MKCRRCSEEKEQKEFKYYNSGTCKVCRKEMDANTRNGIINKLAKSENYIKIENFFIENEGEHTSKKIGSATGVKGNLNNYMRQMLARNMLVKTYTKNIITYRYISDTSLHKNVERKVRKYKEKVLDVDISDFNPELEMDRRLMRWIDSGMSQSEMIVKIADYKVYL